MAESDGRWLTLMTDLEQEVRAWRQAHSRATLTEIEGELDRRLQAARAALLEEVAAGAVEDQRCPTCGGALLARGSRERTLTTQGNEPLALRRRYLHCPACESGLFPPG